MLEAYVDSSVIVALAFDEPSSKAVAARLRSFDVVHSAQLLEAELRSALRREQRTMSVRLLDSIQWVTPTRSLSREIEAVLETGYLRGADCWHVAVALYLSPDPSELVLLTLDRRQRDVARALGFAT